MNKKWRDNQKKLRHKSLVSIFFGLNLIIIFYWIGYLINGAIVNMFTYIMILFSLVSSFAIIYFTKEK